MKNILDVVVPARCVLCGYSSSRSICEECFLKLDPIGEIYCDFCGKQTNVVVERCRHCRSRRKSFSRHRSMFTYDATMRSAIHKMKYFRRKDVAYTFGRSMYQATRGFIEGPFIVCPVPMSKSRLRAREFNQVELMSRGFMQGYHEEMASRANEKAHQCELVYGGHVIKKEHDNSIQHKLHKKDRIKNVKGVYEATRRARGTVSSAIVIDDVYTTGATINECSLALRKAGYKEVVALTLARTPGIY